MNNPINYVDYEGTTIHYFFDSNTFTNQEVYLLDSHNVLSDKSDLINSSELGLGEQDIELHNVHSRQEFVDEWNDMDDTNGIDAVIIYTHAGPGAFQFSDGSNTTKYHANEYNPNEVKNGKELESKDINVLVSLGCNTGNTNKMKYESLYANSRWIPELFINELGVKHVVGATGNTMHSDVNGHHRMYVADYILDYNIPIFNHKIEIKRFYANFNLYYGKDAGLSIPMLKKYDSLEQILLHVKNIETYSMESE